MRETARDLRPARKALIWAALALAVLVPLAFAISSPLLAWRGPVYIAAGLAGIIGLGCILLQPLLVGGYLPLHPVRQKRLHRWVGGTLLVAIVLHVGGLWITSPPDVVDALTFTSPTPFSAWGVAAMWAAFAAAALVLVRRRLGLRPRTWRMGHTALVLVVVIGTIVHAVLITGTMETVSKVALCALAAIATLIAIARLRVWQR